MAKSNRPRWSTSRCGYKVVLALVSLPAVLGLLPILVGAFIDNLNSLALLSVVSLLGDSGGYWHGAGLHSISEKQTKAFIFEIYASPAERDSCTLQEKEILQNMSILPRYRNPRDIGSRMQVLMLARQQECAGNISEAVSILNNREGDSEFDAQKVSLLRRSGQDDKAFSMAVRYVCPSSAEWCEWCLANAGRVSGQDKPGDLPDDSIWRFSNGSPDDLHHTDMQTMGPLQKVRDPNVIEETTVPLVITGVFSQRDNYVEYSTLPVAGTRIRWRIRGEVIGSSTITSCLSPRMVFWSSGKYAGEIAHWYPVTGKFEVDLWSSLPNDATAVTPRITFDNACFNEGQRIAICAVELAVSQ